MSEWGARRLSQTPQTMPVVHATVVQNPKSSTLLHLRMSRPVTKTPERGDPDLRGKETLHLHHKLSPRETVEVPEPSKALLRVGRGNGVPRRIPAWLTLVHSSLLTPHQVSIKSTVKHVIQLFSKITDVR